MLIVQEGKSDCICMLIFHSLRQVEFSGVLYLWQKGMSGGWQTYQNLEGGLSRAQSPCGKLPDLAAKEVDTGALGAEG